MPLRFQKIAAFFVIFFMLICFAFPTGILADTIVIAADNWCPVNCEPGSSNPGFMVEIARSVFSKAGHRVVYKRLPWSRTLLLVRHGKINGAIGPYVEDAPDFIFPENEQGMISFQVFVTKDSTWKYNGVSSFEDILLGTIRDYSYLDEVDTYVKKNKINNAKIFSAYGDEPLKQNIKLLLRGNVDALIETDMVFWHTANQMGIQNEVKSAGVAVKPAKAFIAFSPARPESRKLAKILSLGMDELRKTGELETIMNKYGLHDWKK